VWGFGGGRLARLCLGGWVVVGGGVEGWGGGGGVCVVGGGGCFWGLMGGVLWGWGDGSWVVECFGSVVLVDVGGRGECVGGVWWLLMCGFLGVGGGWVCELVLG